MQGYAGWAAELERETVVLDDGSQVRQPEPVRYPPPGLTAANTVRAGDAVEAGLTGVVDGRGGTYAIQPVGDVVFRQASPRPAPPARTNGNVRVAFFSLGDYFDVTTGTGGPRGANSPEEFVRQRDKLTRALIDLNADIIGVSKLENDGFAPDGALADLADALNGATAPGTYAFVDPGLPSWGGDAVTVGVLYRSAAVVPVGAPAILTTGAYDQQTPPVHRAPMAQTFEERTWGERFIVVVNEWHDRTACPAGGDDADGGDGQGCWNAARTAAAGDLLAWLASDPTGSGDPDYLVVGELNAFGREDPLQELAGAGYVDLIELHAGPDAITSLSNGAAGYTDHALASPGMAPQVAGAGAWAINAEEPPALDYQTEDKSAAQQASLYAPDPYRSSDQNPVVVDLSLVAEQGDLGGNYGSAWHTGQGAWRLGTAWGGEDDGAARTGTDWNDGQGELEVTVNGPGEGQYGCLYGWLDFGDGTTEPGVADDPDGDWDPNENVLAGKPMRPGNDQTVVFALPPGAIGAGTLNMRLRLVPAPDPFVPDCEPARLASPATLGPTGRADGGEVEDYAFEPVPLAVDLVLFASRVEEGRIVLRWETGSEQDLSGFELERGPTSGGPWERVTDVPIPARRPGSSVGAGYEYADRLGQESVVWHRLTAIDLDGQPAGAALTETLLPGPNALHLAGFDAAPAEAWHLWLVTLAAGLGALVLATRRRRAGPR